MKSTEIKQITVVEALRQFGIQPHTFSFFLKAYIDSEKKKKRPKDTIQFHLSRVLVSQAELIEYHMRP